MDYSNKIGVLVPRVLLPKEAPMEKWAVVACDQFTSQPEYWESADKIVGETPSTLRLVLPEAYLGKPEEAERIAAIKKNMVDYLDNGVMKELDEGLVLIRRYAEGKTRWGLIMALDLERYDYQKGSTTLVRATEGTIVSRIPPRLRVREGAALELPHILILIDDPEKTVIEPLIEKAEQFETLYDCDLMLDGGHITGHFVKDGADITAVLAAMEALADPAAFDKKYPGKAPLLFALGDGNHSFATAKAYWEQLKANLPAEELIDHPARYALVEIENVHDTGIVFEPIHRVVFGAKDSDIEALGAILKEQNGSCEISASMEPVSGAQVLPFFTDKREGAFIVAKPVARLAVGTLQNAIDAFLKANKGTEVDYIHGASVVKDLAKKGALGFLLPAMEKSELFPTVVYDGALPRKTFSMGEANEKRYYLEARKIVK